MWWEPTPSRRRVVGTATAADYRAASIRLPLRDGDVPTVP